VGIVTGGTVIPAGTSQAPGTRAKIYYTEAVPTDANIGFGTGTPANGTIAMNVLNGNVYERQAGVWTRIDTL
jgi:hypothetical protein